MSKAVDAISPANAALDPLEERATWLSYAGLIPFLLTAVALWMSPVLLNSARTYQFLLWELLYAAVILSFLGGIRWGLAMMQDRKISEYITISQLTNSVVPPLIAWLAVVPANLIPGVAPNYFARHLLVALAFGLMMQADSRASADGFAPAWYGPMRRKVSMFLGMILLLIIIRLMTLGW